MESLIVNVERVEEILLEYAPDIAAEVLSRVWLAARPPKSGHKAPRPKYPPVPVHETRPKAVWEQRCWRCSRDMKAGETAYAAVEMPGAVCKECNAKPFPGSNRRSAVCEVIVVAA